jgi:hypothetical protein
VLDSRRRRGCLSLVNIVCCQVEVSLTGWTLVRRSRIESGVSVISKPQQGGRLSPLRLSSHEKKNPVFEKVMQCINTVSFNTLPFRSLQTLHSQIFVACKRAWINTWINTCVISECYLAKRCRRFSSFVVTTCILVGPTGGAVQGVGLRPFACWDCGFESHRGYECLSLLSAVLCQVEASATGWSLVHRTPTDCCASLCAIYKTKKWESHAPRWLTAP